MSWWIVVNLPYLTLHILRCDCCSRPRFDVDAKTICCAALIWSVSYLRIWTTLIPAEHAVKIFFWYDAMLPKICKRYLCVLSAPGHFEIWPACRVFKDKLHIWSEWLWICFLTFARITLISSLGPGIRIWSLDCFCYVWRHILNAKHPFLVSALRLRTYLLRCSEHCSVGLQIRIIFS